MIPIILGSGSSGNAIILDNILIDCGVSFKKLEPYIRQLTAVCMTHAHKDHLQPATVKRLAKERPSLWWICGEHLTGDLLACGVRAAKIVPLKNGQKCVLSDFSAEVVNLYHDVPNVGYRLNLSGTRIFYATDTSTLDGIEAKNFDLYLIEANYGEDEIKERIRQKKADGLYCYEERVLKTHLSREQAEAWLAENAGQDSEYMFIHIHEERE